MTDTDLPSGSSATSSDGRRKSDRAPLPPGVETILLVATALVVALVIKTFLVQAFYIPSGSMRETLHVDDRILVEKVSYWFGDIKRGDVVVFDDPASWLSEEAGQTPDNALTRALAAVGLYPTGGHLVKRVIGVGGDTVACRRGKVDVNGIALVESSYVTLPQQACSGEWTYDVPPDHLWVMGDNREHSADSRVHTGDPGGGFIPVDDVVGRVLVVVWPPSRLQHLTRPSTFDTLALDATASGLSTPGTAGLTLAVFLPLLRRLKKKARR